MQFALEGINLSPAPLTPHQSGGISANMDTRINQAPFFFVISLFHGPLMGSWPGVGIQRHEVLLMIICGPGNCFTADSPNDRPL